MSGSTCKSCGNTDRPDTTCSHCGGHGMVNNGEDISECWHCGYSGMQWPPLCPKCSKFRSMEGWAAAVPCPEETPRDA